MSLNFRGHVSFLAHFLWTMVKSEDIDFMLI